MRRGVVSLLTIVGLGIGAYVWHPARVAVQTLLLLPALFPSAPFDPVSRVTATPVQHRRRRPARPARPSAVRQ